MRAWGLVLIIGVSGCGGDDGDTPIDAPAGQVDATVDAAIPTRTLFLNRNGGMYGVGPFDSVANTQTYSNAPVNAAAYPGTEQQWITTRDCVASLFAPFRVNVVDVDPGPADHVEVLVTTTPQQFGLSSSVFSVAPADPQCLLLERGLALSFATPIGPAETRGVCEQTAAIAGIVYGLDWALHCPDLMTYLGACGEKAFRDVDAMCGEQTARACRCGGTTQNSFEFLAGRLGID